MTISNRTEFEAALKRRDELQREAGTDPEKQRELRELNEKLDAYRRASPAEAGHASQRDAEADQRVLLSGQSVYDPHNQNNVGTGVNDPNKDAASGKEPARTPTPSPSSPAGTPQQTPGTPGSSTGGTGNR